MQVGLFGAKGEKISLNPNKGLSFNFCLVSDTETDFHRTLLVEKVGDVHVVRAALELPNLEIKLASKVCGKRSKGPMYGRQSV